MWEAEEEFIPVEAFIKVNYMKKMQFKREQIINLEVAGKLL